MSSILKALKKLEQEQAASQEPVRIDAEILRPQPVRRRSPLTLSLGAALLFACGVSVTYIALEGRRLPDSPEQPPRSPLSSSGTRRLPLERTLPATASVPPAQTGVSPPLTPEPSPPYRLHPSRSPVQSHQPSQSPPSVPVRPRPEPPKKGDSRTTLPPAPELRVDGIAFQEGGAGIAVVNGVTVSKGEFVAGARVEEVRRDRVVFSHGEKTIEVNMGRSTR